jgi:hypothetical protein
MSSPPSDVVKEVAAVKEELLQLLREVKEAHSKEIRDLEARHSKQISELKAEIIGLKESYDAELDEVRRELQEVQDCFDVDTDGSSGCESCCWKTQTEGGRDEVEAKHLHCCTSEGSSDLVVRVDGAEEQGGKPEEASPTSQPQKCCSRCGGNNVAVYGPYRNNRLVFKCADCGSQAKPVDHPSATSAERRNEHKAPSTPRSTAESPSVPPSRVGNASASQPMKCKRCGSAKVTAYGPFRYWYAPHCKWRYRCSNCGSQACPHRVDLDPTSLDSSKPILQPC